MLTISNYAFAANQYKTNKGFTLVELIITIILTGLAMVMFSGIYASTQLKSISPVTQVKAAELAQSYLEEISLRRFDENSPIGNRLRCDQVSQPTCSNTLGSEVSELRVNFDDVDDYNNLNESPPKDTLGNVRSGFNGFSTSISVSYAGSDQGFSTRDLKKIQVTITSPENDLFVFSMYKGNF